ncbi:MAG: efflux RND transporter permease subunit [Lentisphaerota bacterium]
MNFSEIFIRRPVATILLVVTALIFGGAAYFEIPVSDLPSVEYPVVTIYAFNSGCSPETMASTVANPIEKQCTQISGIENIISVNTDGSSRIMLTFNISRSVNELIPDIQSAISKASRSLPDNVDEPTFSKYNPSDRPIMYVMAYSDKLSRAKLYDLINQRVVQPLTMLDGVSKVDINGSPYAVRIDIDPKLMASRGVTFGDVNNAINAENISSSGGTISGSTHSFTIQADAQLKTAKEYNELIVKYQDNKPVRIRDIGNATMSSENRNFNLKFYKKDQEAITNPIMLFITRKSDSNTVALAKSVKKLLADASKQLPNDVHIDIVQDSSTTIIKSIIDVQTTLVLAFIFVLIVIYIFLGRIRDTIIPGVILPITIVFTFLPMYFLGYTIDNLSLMAIILAIGFIVDDSIVVLENTTRHIENGVDPFNAAIKSAKEITPSIISMTISLAIVFIPIVFMQGIVGRTFREFSITVIITIFASCILSLTLTPMMSAYMLSPISLAKKNKFEIVKDKYLDKMISAYSKSLKIFLDRPSLAFFLWTLCIVGTVVFYIMTPKTFLPKGDSGMITGRIKGPLGVSASQMREYQNYANEDMRKDPNIDRFFTMTGSNEGADQSSGMIMAILKDSSKRQDMDTVLGNMKKYFSAIPYNIASIYLAPKPVLQIATGAKNTAQGAQYSYLVTGIDENSVDKYAAQMVDKMQTDKIFSDVQSDVELNMPVIKLSILRKKASSLGITANNIEGAISSAFSHYSSTQFNKGTNTYDVIIEAKEEFSVSPEDLANIYVKSSTTGKLIPLSTIAEWKTTVTPSTVTHYQQLAAATISFNLSPGISMEEATNAINSYASVIFPPEIGGMFQGEIQQFINTIKSLLILVLIAIFLKYVVLGILYESFIHPFTVLTTLPTATVGGLGTLLLFGADLSLYAYVGIFLLLGIVAKNGIMMVDFAIQQMNENVPPREAIHNACLVRFRPILMTGLTAIMGALPIALGYGADGSVRRSLGLIIVGGMIFSQVITLYITPGVFIAMQKLHEKFMARKKKV